VFQKAWPSSLPRIPMSYLVLARKYRPGTFSEVVGQNHVTRTLKNAIASGRLGHAFLFSGLRGVGKTSVARILAKSLNCEGEHEPGEPCGRCSSCVEVDEGRSLNVVEMDAASHTGVDDIRELREAVMYAPAEGKHKVYIIDEVHMLSKSAFNALLKTLEEPPPRVTFILATTEPHKVPVTIHSRCQRYDFRRIPSAMTAEHLGRICGSEGVEISPDSLHRIAVAAEGSLRDSQSLLDQIVSYAGDRITEEDVNTVLGTLDRGMLIKILKTSFAGNAGDALGTIGEMIDNGADPMRIVLDLIELLRALLLAAELESPESVLDLPEGEMEPIKTLSADTDRALLRVRFALMARAEERMRRSPQPRFHLELAVVHMARAEEVASLGPGGEPSARSAKTNSPPEPAAPKSGNVHVAETRGETSSPSPAPPAFAAIETPEETWEGLVDFINGQMPNIGSILEHLVCLKIAGDELVIGGAAGELYLEILNEREKKSVLEHLVGEFFSRSMRVRLTEMDTVERTRNQNIIEKNENRESDFARKIRKETLEHAAIKNAIEIFNGKVERVRVLSSWAPETLEIEEKEEET